MLWSPTQRIATALPETENAQYPIKRLHLLQLWHDLGLSGAAVPSGSQSVSPKLRCTACHQRRSQCD